MAFEKTKLVLTSIDFPFLHPKSAEDSPTLPSNLVTFFTAWYLSFSDTYNFQNLKSVKKKTTKGKTAQAKFSPLSLSLN